LSGIVSPDRNCAVPRCGSCAWLWRRGSTLSASLAPLLATASDTSILQPAGPVARNERLMLLDSLTIMLAIVVPTLAVILLFAWWFRASNTRARYRPEWTYSGTLELLTWSIPTLVILFLGGVIWLGSHALDPAQPLRSPRRPLEVQVVALDWKWLFIYPAQRVASVNELVVPVGVPVHFSLTSASVMNAFFVPELGSMIYAMHGMETQLNLVSDRAEDLYGESAQFSGDGFSDMHFAVHAVAEPAFETWIEQVRQSGPQLDRSTYLELTAQSRNVQPFTYRSAEPGLFHAIVMQQLPPGPGPDAR
jgi:cytochrome o ubiquinol oxidase subunit II